MTRPTAAAVTANEARHPRCSAWSAALNVRTAVLMASSKFDLGGGASARQDLELFQAAWTRPVGLLVLVERFHRLRACCRSTRADASWPRSDRWSAQVSRRARLTQRLRGNVANPVIHAGRAVSEAAAAFGISWWTVRATLNEACLLTLPTWTNSPRGCSALVSTGSSLSGSSAARDPARGSGMSPG